MHIFAELDDFAIYGLFDEMFNKFSESREIWIVRVFAFNKIFKTEKRVLFFHDNILDFISSATVNEQNIFHYLNQNRTNYDKISNFDEEFWRCGIDGHEDRSA